MEQGPRVLRPDRAQLFWDMMDLDSQIGPDHLARVVWAFVAGLDLSPLYARIKARDAVAGRPTPDPRVLLALWLYATLDGVGSARALARLCRAHAAHRRSEEHQSELQSLMRTSYGVFRVKKKKHTHTLA